MDEQWTPEERLAHLEERIAVLERMVEVSQTITSTLDLNHLLSIIAQVAAELTRTESASILLLDNNTGELYFLTVTGDEEDEVVEDVFQPFPQGSADRKRHRAS